jgi:hypothetical protein
MVSSEEKAAEMIGISFETRQPIRFEWLQLSSQWRNYAGRDCANADVV